MDQPIVIEECGGVERRGEIIRFCLPFTRGEWNGSDPAGLAVSAGAGQVTRCSWEITQRWPDGSTRLATCTMALDLPSQEQVSLLPSVGLRQPEVPVLDPGTVIEAFSLTIRHPGDEQADLRLETTGPGHGILRRTTAVGDAIEISGRLAAAGQGSYALQLTLLNPSTHPVTVAGVRCTINAETLLAGPPAICELGNRDSRHSGESHPRFLQLSRTGRLEVDGREPEEIQYPLGGECRQNPIWLRAATDTEGYTIAVRNFGENFPCGCSIHGALLHIDLWPVEAGPLTLAPGMEKTHCLGLIRDTGGPAGGFHAAQRIHLPLAAALPVQRLELLGCFPAFAPYKPRTFPKLETWTKWVMANKPRSYGYFDFGDEPNFSYLARAADTTRTFSLNNEYDYPLIALTEFCRTGDRLWLEDGRAAALHMMDIDTATVHPDPAAVGGQYAHSQGHIHSGPHPDHEWLEGLLLHHLLSGDERPRRYARALADRLAALAESGAFDSEGMTARRYGWPLIALCSFHGFSGEKRYLTAATRIVDGMRRVEEVAGGLRSPYWGTPFWSLDTFMLGIAAAALGRYHRITGEEECRRMIVSSCDAMLQLASPEGILTYKEYPLVRLPEVAAGSLCLEALAYGYELTHNREYLLMGARNLEYLVETTRTGVHIHWNAEERRDTSAADERPAAYMRARLEELTAQYIGVAHRGIWPFLRTAERAGFFTPRNNPFAFIVDADD